MYLLDTSTWIEIFLGTKIGAQAKVKTKEKIFTASITISEVSKWCYLNNIDPIDIISRIENSSTIIQTTIVSEQRAGWFWVEANKNTKGKQVGLVDCIIAAIAEENDLVVLTKDRHFLKFEKIKKEII